MTNKEFAIWGTKKGNEDLVRVNGKEVQTDYTKAKKIKSILEKRGDFEKVRIQKINLKSFDLKKEFGKTLGGKK